MVAAGKTPGLHTGKLRRGVDDDTSIFITLSEETPELGAGILDTG